MIATKERGKTAGLCIILCITVVFVFAMGACDNTSDPTADVNFTTAPVLALTAGDGKLNYTITASVPAADSYVIYYVQGATATVAEIKAGTELPDPGLTGEITDLTNDQDYRAIVVAKKEGYIDGESAIANGKPAAASPANTVTVDPGSDTGATAGNATITGLTTGKYYIVEQGTNIYFAKADGTLTGDLGEIEALTGTALTGLTNGTTYKVNAATAFANGELETYFHASGDPSVDGTADIENGVLILTTESVGVVWGVNLGIAPEKTYEVMRLMDYDDYGTDEYFEEAWDDSRTSARAPDAGEEFEGDIPDKEFGIYIYESSGKAFVYVPVNTVVADFLIFDVEDKTLSILTVDVTGFTAP